MVQFYSNVLLQKYENLSNRFFVTSKFFIFAEITDSSNF